MIEVQNEYKKYQVPEYCRGIVEGEYYTAITFGCQMNEHDTEVFDSLLKEMGYEYTQDSSKADLIVINTCCVRETAENKIFGLIGRLKKLKKENPRLMIAVGGCMTQQEGMGKRIKERFHHVDVIFGTHNILRLPELVKQARDRRKQVLEVWSSSPEELEDLPERTVEGPRAWVCITYGCNNFCSYCIVPYVRGRERSRPAGQILNEIRDLTARGIKEVTLLGQNVNSYGRGQDIDFSDLLMSIEEIEGLERIRYMTSHPRDFSDKLVGVLSNSRKICEHVHLPVQAGSNKILKAMNRGYTREEYMELVEKIRRAVPEVSITTDIIVGFPGETEEDFSDTVDLVNKIQFDSAFIFVYNKRRGTPAAEMSGQVPAEVKSRRIQELIALQNDYTLQSHERDTGKVHQVLVEGRSRTREDKLTGRTRTNKVVVFEGEECSAGDFVPVEINGYNLTHLEGEVIKK